MKQKKRILGILFVVSLVFVGCGNNIKQSYETKMNQETTELAISVKNLIIYAQDVSVSLRAIDRYSLTMDGDAILKSYVFDQNCTFYDVNRNEISFEQFATEVNQSYAINRISTKCRIVSDNKLVTEVYIVE